MTDWIDLALTYGGFTSLDRLYLETHLSYLTEEEILTFITPPPSVVNAYFAELYQKQGPEVATAYFLDLSKALNLFGATDFKKEVKPFIRLNLSGKSYGFSYLNAQEEAEVFAQEEDIIRGGLLLDIAQLFPHYKVFQEGDSIKMKPIDFDETEINPVPLDLSFDLLTNVDSLKQGFIKISGYNREGVLKMAAHLSDQLDGPLYSAYSNRQFIIYGREKIVYLKTEDK